MKTPCYVNPTTIERRNLLACKGISWSLRSLEMTQESLFTEQSDGGHARADTDENECVVARRRFRFILEWL